MNDSKIYAVDFDGTLCENKWPEIGEPIQEMIDYCIKLRENGHRLILWTCRTEEQTKEAVKWCNDRDLFFHAVNSNLPDEICKYNNDPRKIGADYFIDDKNLSIRDIIKPSVLTAKKVNILGTDYSIHKKTYDEEPCLKKNNWSGYCNAITHEIVLLDLDSDVYMTNESQLAKDKLIRTTLRHEIVHAFLNESGLQDDGNQYGAAWCKNEEMVDWFAIQSPKIYKVYEELGIL